MVVTTSVPALRMRLFALVALLGAMLVAAPLRAEGLIEPFVGDYVGSATMVAADGTQIPRDMNVTIRANKEGFTVDWTSTTRKPDGRLKSKSYSIDFLPTERDGVFSAGMRKNVFGHAVQLDPMKGEPFVWGRIRDDMLTIFSLFVDEDGDYEIQQFDRTLAEGGLHLKFTDWRNGESQRSVETFLDRK